MAVCKNCGKTLTCDETGLYQKVVSRDAREYKCLPCLAEFFGCDDEILREKIRHFKKMGCALFARE